MSRKTRKLIWSAPLVAVLAVAGALAMFVILVPDGAQADHITLPGVPMNVALEADGARAIKLSWDPPADNGGSAIIGYRIDYLDMASGKIWKELQARVSGTEYTDTYGLSAGDERAYRVFAMNALGTGPVSEVVDIETGAVATPGQVSDFGTPRIDGPTQLTLNWATPSKDGGGAITSYRIHMAGSVANIPEGGAADQATNPDDVIKASDVGDQSFDPTDVDGYIIDTGTTSTQFSVPGLRAQQTWHFQVFARNDEGNSADASPTRTQTTGPSNKPGKPIGLRAVSGGAATGLINLYWYWPAHDGGAEITQFRVEVRQDGKGWPDSTAAAAVNMGLFNDALTGDDGNAVFNASLNATTTYDFQHTGISDDLDGDDLVYRVFTETETGPLQRSDESNSDSAEVDADDTILGATDVTAGEGSTGVVELTWIAPTGAGTGYRIDYAVGGEGTLKWMQEESNTSFADLPYEHEELKPGTTYRYRVSAHPVRRGLASSLFEGMPGDPTRPGKTQNLVGTVVNAGQVDLIWDPPTSDGGSPITKYTVHVASMESALEDGLFDADTDPLTAEALKDLDFSDGTTVGAVIDTRSSDTMYSLKGLRAQQTWYIMVVAHNAATEGDLVGSEAVVKTTPAFAKPAGPVGLLAESAVDSNLLSRNKRGVLLLWNQPAAPAGAEITSYEINRKVDDGEFVDEATLEGSTLSTFYTDDSEPKMDEVRVYRVRTVAKATSAATDSMMSDWVEVRSPADTSHMAATGTLGEVSDVTATSDTDGEVTVMWMGGDNADRYFIIALERGSSPLVIGFARAESGASEATITGLNSDASHLVIVLALKGTGDDRELEYGTDTVTVQ